MRKRTLFWHLYPSYLAIACLSLLAVAAYTAEVLHRVYLDTLKANLETNAVLLAERIDALSMLDDPGAIDAMCKQLSGRISTRITVIGISGEVLGESDNDPHDMESHLRRPEIQTALRGAVGSSTRYSGTLQREMMYVAIPLHADGETAGAVRTSISTSSIDGTLRDVYLLIGVGVLIVTGVVAVVSLAVSRNISRPLIELEQGAERFAGGNSTGGSRCPMRKRLAAWPKL